MHFSLRVKFTLLMSAVIMLVLATNMVFVLQQKYRELNDDTFHNAVSFAELVSFDVLDKYQQTYNTNNFLKLPGEVKSLLELNNDIHNVQIVAYDGGIRYNFQEEETAKYKGDPRVVANAELKERLQSNYPSLKTLTGQVVYMEKDQNGIVKFIDNNGKPLAKPYNTSEQIETIVYPVRQKESFALIYSVSYDLLAVRIWETTRTTLVLTVGYIGLGILIAFFYASRIVKPIKKLTESSAHIAQGKFGEVIPITSKDEVGTLASSFNKMSVELKSVTDQLVQKERLAKEVELASKIQEEFLPKKIPFMGGLDIYAGVIPAEAVGGDCYDFIKLDEDHLLFYIGDVTGHGVSAGLITAIANSLVYSLSFSKEAHNPRELSLALNKVLRMKTRPDMFITLFIAVWNAKTGELVYTPCGHEPTYIYKKKSKQVALLEKGGIALGMIDRIEPLIKKNMLTVEDGDVLVLYTDGIPEAWSPKKELYGLERLEASLKKHAHKTTAKEIYDGILKDVYAFMGGVEQADDVSLVILKKNKA